MERKELQEIVRKATEAAEKAANPHWVYAYEDLARAANNLDVMIARSEMADNKDLEIMDSFHRLAHPFD